MTLLTAAGAFVAGVPSAHAGAFPGWNGRIGFQSDRTGAVELYSVSPAGTSTQIVGAFPSRNMDFAWSPDGTGLAFTHCCPGGHPEIYSMNANLSGVRPLTFDSARHSLPAWSPDGRRIAYVSTATGNRDIWVMYATGYGQVDITRNVAADDQPAWSPGGTTIAFASNRSGSMQIWAMNPDGTGLRQLTYAAGTNDEPTWSPDGTKIAFESNRTGKWQVFVMNADGTGQHNVSNSSSNDNRPAWSPNGAQIAFDSDRTGHRQIFTMNADGTGQRDVSNSSSNDERPDWRPANVMPKFTGIDVSNWQGPIDFQSVAVAGFRFVFAKATEGLTFNDTYYPTYRAGAQAAGLAFGAYHYARPSSTPGDAVRQADHFISVAAPRTGDLVPVLDLEETGGLSPSGLQSWVSAFLGEVQARLGGVKAIIYTSPTFWQTRMADTSWFGVQGYRLLWIANWNVARPFVPGGFWGGKGWTFWQTSDCWTVPGTTGCVDRDVFNGVNVSAVTVP